MNRTEILTELRRELATRQRVYPDWIRAVKLSQRTADHRIAAIASAIALIESLPVESKSEQMSLLG
jgi:hypothetical protein